MTHEIKIEPKMEKSIGTVISIDGIPLHTANAYYLSQDAGETPSISIRFTHAAIKFEQNCNVRVYNKEEIAKCMDRAEFMRFCDIWKEIHSDKS